MHAASRLHRWPWIIKAQSACACSRAYAHFAPSTTISHHTHTHTHSPWRAIKCRRRARARAQKLLSREPLQEIYDNFDLPAWLDKNREIAICKRIRAWLGLAWTHSLYFLCSSNARNVAVCICAVYNGGSICGRCCCCTRRRYIGYPRPRQKVIYREITEPLQIRWIFSLSLSLSVSSRAPQRKTTAGFSLLRVFHLRVLQTGLVDKKEWSFAVS